MIVSLCEWREHEKKVENDSLREYHFRRPFFPRLIVCGRSYLLWAIAFFLLCKRIDLTVTSKPKSLDTFGFMT